MPENRVRQSIRDLAHAFEAVGEFPVRGHAIQSQGTHRSDQRVTARVDGRQCSMKRIAIVERNHGTSRFAADVAKYGGKPFETAAGTDVGLMTEIEQFGMR